MDTAKNAGWKTTEFRLVAGYIILAALLDVAQWAGWLTPDQAKELQANGTTIIANAGAALGMIAYTLSRSGLKWKWLNNLAQGQQPSQAPTFAPLVDSPPAPSYSSPAQPQNGVVTGGLSAVQPQQIRSV